MEQKSIGEYQNATRVVADFRGRVFVLDQGSHLVYCYPTVNEKPWTVGGYGWRDGNFDVPTDVATDGINTYVTDYGNHRVQRFDQQLRFVGVWAGRAPSGSQAHFGYPLGIALTEVGEWYVLDGENIRICKFSPNGELEKTFGDIPTRDGKLSKPRRLSLVNDFLYVLDADRIFQYDLFGSSLRTIGNGIFSNARGICFTKRNILVATGDTLYVFSHDGIFLSKIPRTHIFAETTVDEITDIAWGRDVLYLLTAKRLHLLELRNQ